jgi:hypothetical protein
VSSSESRINEGGRLEYQYKIRGFFAINSQLHRDRPVRPEAAIKQGLGAGGRKNMTTFKPLRGIADWGMILSLSLGRAE